MTKSVPIRVHLLFESAAARSPHFSASSYFPAARSACQAKQDDLSTALCRLAHLGTKKLAQKRAVLHGLAGSHRYKARTSVEKRQGLLEISQSLLRPAQTLPQSPSQGSVVCVFRASCLKSLKVALWCEYSLALISLGAAHKWVTKNRALD